MQRIILVYGIIAGLVIITVNTANLEFGRGQAWLGFLVMFITFSTIYVAVRQHRNETLGGVITFSNALWLGLGIAAVAGVVYVGIWEVYLALSDYRFFDEYISAVSETNRAAGMSETEIAQQTNQLQAQFGNPLLRLPLTFMEIFPVGCLVSLISAVVLRNHGNKTEVK